MSGGDKKSLVIAVDFDGTLVSHKFPEIGEPLPYAFEVCKILQENGHKLILWTFRDGLLLQEAVQYCSKNGLKFYSINHSHPDEDYDKSISRKINADLFIDDRNIGGLPEWPEILKFIHPEIRLSPETETKNLSEEITKPHPKGGLLGLFSKKKSP